MMFVYHHYRAATVQIPQPPASRTVKALEEKKENRKRKVTLVIFTSHVRVWMLDAKIAICKNFRTLVSN